MTKFTITIALLALLALHPAGETAIEIPGGCDRGTGLARPERTDEGGERGDLLRSELVMAKLSRML